MISPFWLVCLVVFGLLGLYVLLPVAVVLVGCWKLLKMKVDGTIGDLRASIPFRRSHWLLGAVADMDLGGFHEFVLQNTLPFGDCKSWADFMFIHPMAFILDPRDTSFILGSGQQHFSKVARAKDLLSFFFGTSMVVLDGEPWKRIRKLFNPAFHFEAVNKTQPTIVARTVNLLNVLNKYASSHPDADTISKPTLDFGAHAQNLTLDVLGLIVFDFDMKCQTDETCKFRQALNSVIHETFVGFTRIYPQFSWKYVPSIRKERAKAEEAKQMIVDVIQSIIKQRREEKLLHEHKDFKRDLLGTMLQAKHDGVEWITDNMLVDEMMLFLMAGSDTTSWLLTMAVAYLVTHPHTAKKLYAEIDQFTDVVRANANGNNVAANATHHRMASVANDIHYDENGSISVGGGGSAQWQGTIDDENDVVVPTSKTALQLPYLNAFVKETLRLQPPAPIVGREAIEPYVLPSGLKVHPGVSLTICPYVIHRSKALWGEDALEFKPERWLNPNAPPNNGPYKVPLSTAFVPFMAGQRNCIGQNLARLEAALVLSLLLQRFTFSFPAGFQVKTEFYLTMCMPGGLSVLVDKRKTRSFSSSAPLDHDHATAASVAP